MSEVCDDASGATSGILFASDSLSRSDMTFQASFAGSNDADSVCIVRDYY